MVMAESQQIIINLTGKIEVSDDGIKIAGSQREFRGRRRSSHIHIDDGMQRSTFVIDLPNTQQVFDDGT